MAAQSGYSCSCKPWERLCRPFLLDMLPYVLTLGVLAVWTGAADRAMPEGLKTILRAGLTANGVIPPRACGSGGSGRWEVSALDSVSEWLPA